MTLEIVGRIHGGEILADVNFKESSLGTLRMTLDQWESLKRVADEDEDGSSLWVVNSAEYEAVS